MILLFLLIVGVFFTAILGPETVFGFLNQAWTVWTWTAWIVGGIALMVGLVAIHEAGERKAQELIEQKTAEGSSEESDDDDFDWEEENTEDKWDVNNPLDWRNDSKFGPDGRPWI